MQAAVYNSVLEMIGHTPLVRLNHLAAPDGGEVWVKLEFTNPGGSLKDRTCLGMIRDAEQQGRITPGEATLIEPTAGNTGIGLALVGRASGYRVICVLPENFSLEKQVLIEALGGRVVRTPDEEGMAGAIERARRLCETTPGAVMLQQFENPSNPDIHRRTTAPELWDQMEGRIDGLCVGGGTGGTFSGISRFMKEKDPNIVCALIQPQGSVFDGGEPGPHIVEGIGGTFIPRTLDLSLADEILTVHDREALTTVRDLAREEGLLVGGSAGAVTCGALRLARRLGPGKRVAAILADPAERYMSKGYFRMVEEWESDKGENHPSARTNAGDSFSVPAS